MDKDAPKNVSNTNTKEFSNSTNTIYNFMTAFVDKYGTMTLDWMGYVFGLNKNGKPISEQSPEEVSENLQVLAKDMENPEVRESIEMTIKEAEPVLQEAAQSFLNVAMSSAEFVVKDAVDIACHSDTIDPLCGAVKVAEDTINFGDNLVQSADQAVHAASHAVEAGEHIAEELQHNASENLSNPITNVPNPIENAGEQLKQQTKLQQGGAKMLKKQKQNNKIIENRVQQSIYDFLHLKKRKSRKRKVKSSRRNKSKANR